jgi:hypothetical protein
LPGKDYLKNDSLFLHSANNPVLAKQAYKYTVPTLERNESVTTIRLFVLLDLLLHVEVYGIIHYTVRTLPKTTRRPPPLLCLSLYLISVSL